MPFLTRATDRIERANALDAAIRTLDPIAAPLNSGRRGAVLRGEWLGHALHPVLTDLPIGCWTSSLVLDLVGGRRSRLASQRLIAVGLLAVVPTAVTGAVEWQQLPDEQRRRVGVAHAALNGVATVLYLLSWRARRRNRHAVGVSFGLIGSLAAGASAYLGGHLSYARASGVGERGRDTVVPPSDAHALDGKIGA